MNTLTKILIVLLTLSSIFLCGIVATYVSHANNYKQLYETEANQRKIAADNQELAEQQSNTRRKQYELKEKKLEKQIASLTTDINKIKTELKNLKTKKAELDQQIAGWVTIVDDLTNTNNDKQQLLASTLADLKRVEAEQTKEREQLEELTDTLIQKMAIIDTLNVEKRRLEEESHQLQDRLAQLTRPTPRKVTVVTPVTPEKGIAQPVMPPVKQVSLEGVIEVVDLKRYNMAQISIGSAHGVKEGMIFYVTRGRDFVCEVHVFYVDAEKAVGNLKRLDFNPKAGDRVSTSL